jgi:hypothetical protein
MSVYKNFEPDDIVRGNPTEVTIGLWSGNTGSLTSFFTSSVQTTGLSGEYHWDVYNLNPNNSNAEVQFSIAYGHRTGAGHPTLAQSDTSSLAPQAVYSQFRNLLLDPGDTQFTFLGNYNSNNIYVINIERARVKETLDPGNWMLTLSGSNGIRTFIDDSGQALGSEFGRSGRVFNVVSGSLSGSLGSTIAATTSSNNGGFGLFYPSLGLIVLNPAAIAQTVGFSAGSPTAWTGSIPFAPYTGSTTSPARNHAGLYQSIRLGGNFQARSSEIINSTHYFVRVRNSEFNYTNNPTFFDEVTGQINQPTFINNPNTYITTVGLYNSNNELLAVAKTNRPIQKNYNNETLLRVRLDW